MAQVKNTNLTRGRAEYNSKIQDLEGIFSKLQEILDVSEENNEFLQIQQDVENDTDLSTEGFFKEMQADYEQFAFKKYIKRLDDLHRKLEEQFLPYYELHLLSSNIDIQISTVTCENIGEIIQNSINLIDMINSLDITRHKGKNDLVASAYKTIYSTILYEEIFERSDVLSYILQLNIPINIENIGRLLSNDFKSLSKQDLIEEGLRTIKTEGLGYDYLNSDFIRKISRKTVGEINSEYQERKRKAISDLEEKVAVFATKKAILSSKLNNNNNFIKNLYMKQALLTAKMLSMVLVPMITLGAGNALGKYASNKITEYKTITRTIDLNTGNIIGEQEEVFDEKETTYVATIMECSPWGKKPIGSGYIRHITGYDYVVPDNIPDDYHITSEDLVGNTIKKHQYNESKEVLEDSDNTTEYTILVTETYQDKSIQRKSTKYIVPFTVTGILVGLVIDVLMVFIGIYGFEKAKEKFDYLSHEIREHKLNNQDIKEILVSMKNEALQLQHEYNEVVKNYGSLGDQLIIPAIDSSWLKENGMKRDRRRKL